jgi:CubicO group peptidase (beta-lactamase class C family)
VTGTLDRIEIVPGLALAVVVDDRVVLTRGWGVADREAGLPATDETLFYIASSTKPYVALLAAVLDARGTMPLESSLASHAPDVRFDPEIGADRVTLRHLLTHTSGVDNEPIGVRVAFTGQHDPDTLWRLLAGTTPNENHPFGQYRYTNVGYNIYAVLLERETGKPWQERLTAEILDPLGLSRTTPYVSKAERKGWPMARPYIGLLPGGVQRVPLEKHDNTMQSAGGLLTTAEDLGRWLVFQLNDGRLDGRQVIDPAVVRATHEKRTDADDGHPPFGQTGYALGWSIGELDGHAALSHGGGFVGFRSMISFLPDEGIGVAVMANEGSVGGEVANVVLERAYRWWLDGDVESADAAIDELVAKRDALRERIAADLAKRADREWMLSRPRRAYAGTYANDLFGTITVAESDGELSVTWGNLSCVGTPYPRSETIRVELVPGRGEVMAFGPDEGPVQSVELQDEVFERVAEPVGGAPD